MHGLPDFIFFMAQWEEFDLPIPIVYYVPWLHGT